jgi:hypothetical protein
MCKIVAPMAQHTGQKQEKDKNRRKTKTDNDKNGQ